MHKELKYREFTARMRSAGQLCGPPLGRAGRWAVANLSDTMLPTQNSLVSYLVTSQDFLSGSSPDFVRNRFLLN